MLFVAKTPEFIELKICIKKNALTDSKQNRNGRIRATVQHKAWKEIMDILERILLFIIFLSQQKKEIS